MTDDQAMQQIITSLKGNDAGTQKFTQAILSQDRVATKQVVHDLTGVDLTEQQLDTLLSEYADKDKIAAIS
jgi:hypothetical protein